jgi:hypothetical protein
VEHAVELRHVLADVNAIPFRVGDLRQHNGLSAAVDAALQ